MIFRSKRQQDSQQPKNALVPYRSKPIVPANRTPGEVLPVAIGLDTSPSTYACGADAELKAGFAKLLGDIQSSPSLARSVHLAIYGFGTCFSTATKRYQDFSPANNLDRLVSVPDSYGTYIFELYCRIISEVVDYGRLLSRTSDRDSLNPMIFFLSDFVLMEPDVDNCKAAHNAKEMATELGVNVFLVGAGECCDIEVMKDLAQDGRPPILVPSNFNFGELFAAMFRSIRQASCSMGKSTSVRVYDTDLRYDG